MTQSNNPSYPFRLNIPNGWKEEIIPLPPEFASDMTLPGKEYIHFSPGMMQFEKLDFFTYSFVFVGNAPSPSLQVIMENLKSYYQGLQAAVLGSKKLSPESLAEKNITVEVSCSEGEVLTGEILWTEPFVTMKQQRLFFSAVRKQTESHYGLHFVASPVSPSEKIWTETLFPIQDSFKLK